MVDPPLFVALRDILKFPDPNATRGFCAVENGVKELFPPDIT